MSSAQKKTQSAEKKHGKEQTSGKKLVQARLPFKILSGTVPSVAPDGSVVSTEIETLSKKRKLSYEDQSENPNKKVGKSESKENSTIGKDDETIPTQEVIILDDEEPEIETEPTTPISSTKSKRKIKNTPSSTGKSSTPKVQIKLPLSGKKKKRKIELTPRSEKEASDSCDVEIIGEEKTQKKVKLSEDVVSDEILIPDPAKVNSDISKTENHQKNLPTRNENETDKTDDKEKCPAEKASKDPENKTSVAESSSSARKSRRNDKDLQSSPNKNDLQSDTVEKKTPVVQRNVKVSLKRIGSARKSENAENKNESDKTTRTAEEQSLSQNSENIGAVNCDGVSISDSEGDLDKSTAADTSTSSLGKKILTPKQLKLMEHRKKLREEKERKLLQLKQEKDRKLQEQREERERKVQEEKMQKQKEREERELQRKKEREEKDEQKKREKEEKEELKRKEKEDKEKKRLAELEAKNEEKRKRDEAKEEERRKKEEDRRRKELEKEEEENKKKKAAQAFTKFFVPKTVKSSLEEDPESRDDTEIIESLAFRPFQVKGDMKLAPLVRREFSKSSQEELDSFLNSVQPKDSKPYLTKLKSGEHIPLKGCKTVLKDSDDDVVIIENELETATEAIFEARPKATERCKAKFFFFRENRRPPYYGTWRKKSSVITARRPFAIDKCFFDYDVDSDDEWEEEEPGESLNGSEDEKEESEDEDYEVDNEWFVPHGHLSDEELQNEDELGPDTSREAQKAKLKALQQEFAQEMKKKTEKIKPRLFGAIWEDENGNKPKHCPSIIWETLCARAMIICETPLVEEPNIAENESSTPPPEKQKRLEINDDLMIALIRLVHGNRHSRAFLINEYIEHVRNKCETIKNGECLAPTKALIKEKIDEISEWSVLDVVNKKMKKKKKLCWVVSADILNKFSLDKLGLRNEWSYTLQPKFSSDKKDSTLSTETTDETPDVEALDESVSDAKVKKKLNSSSGITKFAKVLTKEEKRNQLSRNSFDANCSSKPTKDEVSKSVKKSLQKTETVKKDKALSTPSVSHTTPVVKKRVALLMSVPPGQDFPAKSKNSLISNFLEMNKRKSTSGKTDENASSYLQKDADDVVVVE